MATVAARQVSRPAYCGPVPKLADLFTPCPKKGCNGTTVLSLKDAIPYCDSCFQAWHPLTLEPMTTRKEVENMLACEDRLYARKGDGD